MRGTSRRTEPPCQRHPGSRPALLHGLLGRAWPLGAPRLPGRDTHPGNGRRQGGDREKGARTWDGGPGFLRAAGRQEEEKCVCTGGVPGTRWG